MQPEQRGSTTSSAKDTRRRAVRGESCSSSLLGGASGLASVLLGSAGSGVSLPSSGNSPPIALQARRSALGPHARLVGGRSGLRKQRPWQKPAQARPEQKNDIAAEKG